MIAGSILVIGTFAVPIIGYLYVAITFGFLNLLQWLGLIEEDAELDDKDNNLQNNDDKPELNRFTAVQ